jgi:hypothetical protein
MKSMFLAALALVLTLEVSACVETTPTQDDPGTPRTLLTYQRSGGFAGLTQRLEVLTDGRATREGTGGSRSEFEVSDERVRQLTETLEGIDWARADDEPANTVCADCYVHDIAYEGHRISTTAIGSSGRELRDLLSLLNTLISEG